MLNLPASVKLIREKAFDDCVSLTDLYYAGGKNDLAIESCGEGCEYAEIHFGDGSSLTLAECAQESPVSGTCGANLTWLLDRDGVLWISGSGAMDDYMQKTEYQYDSAGNRRDQSRRDNKIQKCTW